MKTWRKLKYPFNAKIIIDDSLSDGFHLNGDIDGALKLFINLLIGFPFGFWD